MTNMVINNVNNEHRLLTAMATLVHGTMTKSLFWHLGSSWFQHVPTAGSRNFEVRSTAMDEEYAEEEVMTEEDWDEEHAEGSKCRCVAQQMSTE